MTSRFEGKTAVVTGASRGIGFAIARQLVTEGAKVVITGRDQEALDEAVNQLGGAASAAAVAGKADDPDHQVRTIETAIEHFGSVDLLVNNAGVNPGVAPLVDIDLGAVRKGVELNAMAPLAWVMRAYDAWMRDHGGAVVNISSMGAVTHAPGIGAYGMSKAMLVHLTAQLAVELGPHVRVNAVAPAIVKTRFSVRLYEGREEQAAAAYPLKRLGVPDDISSAVTFLLSDEASWVTGQHLVVDGGLTLLGTVGAEEDPSDALAAAGQIDHA